MFTVYCDKEIQLSVNFNTKNHFLKNNRSQKLLKFSDQRESKHSATVDLTMEFILNIYKREISMSCWLNVIYISNGNIDM